MNHKIGLIPGDGIGPEIVGEAKKVLDRTASVFGHTFEYQELLLGGACIDATGEPITEETIRGAVYADQLSDIIHTSFETKKSDP